MNNKMSGIFKVLLAAVFLATPAFLNASPKVYTDSEIQMILLHDLSRKGIDHVQVQVQNENVNLSGQVDSLWQKNEAVEIATKLDDVKSVKAELTIASAESDQELAKQVVQKLQNYVFYTIYDNVDLNVQNGVVTLSGEVTMPYKSSEMAEMASRVFGVQDVKDDVQVLPVSHVDDELRVRLARQIYRDLPEYATMINPPIHIIVENGRVTLDGVVRSEVERRMAGDVARSTFGVLGVTNNLRLES